MHTIESDLAKEHACTSQLPLFSSSVFHKPVQEGTDQLLRWGPAEVDFVMNHAIVMDELVSYSIRLSQPPKTC
jgi:hypothetical protein